MKLSRLLIPGCLLVATIVYFSCNKSDTPDKPPYKAEYVTASIQGKIVDENELPVSGATVKAGSISVTTNASGLFNLSNISVDKHAGMVTVEKEGYFKGIKTIVVTPNKNNSVSIQLIKKIAAGNFNGNSGGTVTVPSGGNIVFPASGIVQEGSTTAYTGTVSVSAFFINPEASNFSEITPGTLRGINSANQETGLQSFGMMAVELNGANGEKLQLASGKTASLTFPIPASLQGQAPATIPLWSLDEKTGLWKEEGTATRQGNNYVGTVSHFSFWNCDAPFAIIDFTATIKNQQGVALGGVKVVISATGTDTLGSISGHGYTNIDGVVSGKIPANRNLVMKVYNQCGNLTHTQNVGPFTANSDLGVVTVTSTAAEVTISGTVVNCNAAAVTNGYVTIHLDGVYYRSNLINGAFSMPVVRCSNTTASATITPYDIGGTQSGTASTVAISGTTVNAGQFVACGNVLTEYINYNINGTSYGISGTDSMIAYRGQQNNQTLISGFGGDNRSFDMSFIGEPIPGTSPMSQMVIRENNTYYIHRNNTPTITVNITEYENTVGGYVAGNFTGTVKDTLSQAILPINCTFRVKRYQ
ncbi:carboxypeptidase regulatory-like domain-containing protein [Pseudoflavitalea sp. X16]|uniref:carboxypeptidase-like regulatory domain-containing protein n=1 Tax=Paraflavitalea devenefica TaxID=2716334 RepID=UPI00141E6630|nr:carboxypeptidase-like regulatory domain-containing protein [Paraflavitalea devenefica]NII26806.1 carboxypeptidase regulatory-like domain-containing protein [Paraflavitalea devenefica]